MLGALQAARQQVVDRSLTAAEAAIIDALYSENPEWSERLLSAEQIEEKINGPRPKEQRLAPDEISEARHYLHQQGLITTSNTRQPMYILTRRLEISSGDNSLISLLTPQQVLLDRLYYVLADSGGDPQQAVTINELLLGGQDPDRRRLLQRQLTEMNNAGLIMIEDIPNKSSLGIRFRFNIQPPGSPSAVPEALPLLAAAGPEAVWRQQGRLAAAEQRARRRSAQRSLAQAVVKQITAHTRQISLSALFGPQALITDSELIANLQRDQKITISQQQLAEELGWLAKRKIINTNKIKKGQPAVALYFADHPLSSQPRQIAKLDANDSGQQQERFRRYGLAGYYFRRGQVAEQQLAMARWAPSDVMSALSAIFATNALDGAEGQLTIARLRRKLADQRMPVDKQDLQRYLQRLLKRQLIEIATVEDISAQSSATSYRLVV